MDFIIETYDPYPSAQFVLRHLISSLYYVYSSVEFESTKGFLVWDKITSLATPIPTPNFSMNGDGLILNEFMS